MKTCVLGPVFTSKYFGGVATFTESIADAFKLEGHNVQIVTDFSEKHFTTHGVEIVAVFEKPSRKNPLMPWKIAQKVKSFYPDLIISSLEYGLANVISKYLNPSAAVLHFLHGLPLYEGRRMHNLSIGLITNFIAKHSDAVIANSEFTAVLCEALSGLKSDAAMNVCVGYDYWEQLKRLNGLIEKKANTVLFVGRLVPEKNVDKLVRAFSALSLDAELTIIGDGPEKAGLQRLAQTATRPIKFLGKVDPGEVVQYYLASDVFISLGPKESFGIVFLEALSANCKVICPKTGGQLDVLLNYLDRVIPVSVIEEEQITAALETAFKTKVNPVSPSIWMEALSYQSMVNKIERFVSKRKR